MTRISAGRIGWRCYWRWRDARRETRRLCEPDKARALHSARECAGRRQATRGDGVWPVGSPHLACGDAATELDARGREKVGAQFCRGPLEWRFVVQAGWTLAQVRRDLLASRAANGTQHTLFGQPISHSTTQADAHRRRLAAQVANFMHTMPAVRRCASQGPLCVRKEPPPAHGDDNRVSPTAAQARVNKQWRKTASPAGDKVAPVRSARGGATRAPQPPSGAQRKRTQRNATPEAQCAAGKTIRVADRRAPPSCAPPATRAAIGAHCLL